MKINKNMKNKILIFMAIFVFFAIATTTFAMTTVSLSPASVSVEEGQTFNLVISVNSQVVKSYMVKSEIKFPADVLEIQSFNFGNNWVPLSQPGYSLIDNTNGVLIKTAGYPGGLSSQADFGTIVFKAKKNGTGAVQVTGNSTALNAEGLNVMSGLPVQINVVIAQVQVVPPTPQVQTQTQPITTVIPAPKENTTTNLPITEETTAQLAAVVPPTAAQTSLAAAIGGFLTLGTGSVWLGILVVILILAIAAYAVYALIQRKRNK